MMHFFSLTLALYEDRVQTYEALMADLWCPKRIE